MRIGYRDKGRMEHLIIVMYKVHDSGRDGCRGRDCKEVGEGMEGNSRK